MAERRLGLHGHVALVVVHVEQGLGGVGHVPHHDGGDFDGVAHLVVDLQALAVQGAHAGGDGGGQALGGVARRFDALAQGKTCLCGGCGHGVLGGAAHAHALAKERICPEKALVTHGTHVLAKEDAHARLTGLQ